MKVLAHLLLLSSFVAMGVRADDTTPPDAPAEADMPIIMRGYLAGNHDLPLEIYIPEIWKFARSNSGLTTPVDPPVIYFAPFMFSKETPSWAAWQKTWIQQHPEVWDDWHRYKEAYPDAELQESENPFPATLRGYHYAGTTNVQIDPFLTFLAPRQRFAGWGYYSVGHELHHYVLEKIGIPVRLHHCLFITERKNGRTPLMNALADFLVDQSYSAPTVRLFGGPLDMEYQSKPCKDLSPEDLILVEKYKDLL